MNKISKQTYVFHEILKFLPEQDQARMQLLSRKFYDKIVPYTMSDVSIKKSSSHAKKQDKLYQYASGFLMHKNIEDVLTDCENGPQSNSKWNFIVPSNPEYQEAYKLNKSLKYGRTIYVPYNRVIVISGNVNDSNTPNVPVNDVLL